MEWHLYQVILEFSTSQPISELVLQSEVRNRLPRGRDGLVFRFPLQDGFNTIHKPHVSLYVQSKDCRVALADGNVFQQDLISPQQSTNRATDAIPEAETAALILSESDTLHNH